MPTKEKRQALFSKLAVPTSLPKILKHPVAGFDLVNKYAERAHLSDVSPHDLRHRFGYRMAQSVPLHRLAQLMGHDSLNTTMLYVRGTKKDLQQDVEQIAWG